MFFYAYFFFIGIFIVNNTSNITGLCDDKRIVFDEIVGYFIAMSVSFTNEACDIIISLFLFRLFDILKPIPICFIDYNIKNGLGIMMDDLFAALFVVFFKKYILYI
ncbi:phosphatidylglycerophosphatase A [Candidatus Legionella polyplacis]|uniref:Phosphatidylglycerophosphatase A n=1 Tax=Candidatus Legionella polyplacis TaxID=2005262 RepID=A0ABZ2GZ08_9GAMM